MSLSLLTILIFIILIQSVILFLVYQLWKFRLTNLQNQVKMQIELVEILEQIHLGLKDQELERRDQDILNLWKAWSKDQEEKDRLDAEDWSKEKEDRIEELKPKQR